MEFDDAWRVAARTKIATMFPSGVHAAASLMATSHPLAIQYIEQAPVLVLVMSGGRTPASRSGREYIARAFGSAVHSRPRLKDMMRERGLPFCLRKIKAQAICVSREPAIRWLAKIAPSSLSQAIPETTGHQSNWLRGLCRYLSLTGQGQSQQWQWRMFEWLAIETAKVVAVTPKAQIIDPQDVLDYMSARGTTFHTGMSYHGARRGMEDWHVGLTKKTDVKKFLRDHGKRFDEEVDYEGLPHEAHFAGLTFTALRSGEAIFIEGTAMRHCVASYTRSVIIGGTRIYSVRCGETRVATIQLEPKGKGYVLAQIKGPCNSKPQAAVIHTAAKFVQGLRVEE